MYAGTLEGERPLAARPVRAAGGWALLAAGGAALPLLAWLAAVRPGWAALAGALSGALALGGVAGWILARERGRRTAAALERRAEADRRLLREVAARAFRAQETERMRIARELQEETAQTLSGLLLHLRVARGLTDAAAREEVLDEIRAALADTTDTVRRFARGLYPPALHDLGVAAAVQSYADTLSESSGLRITVAAGEVNGLLESEGELALYRVLQEALANAVRHAGARSVEVRIARDGDRVRAAVEDDGRGFDLAAREAAHPCLGLFGMRERARHAGGSTHVESAPGRGTRVTVEIPARADGEEGGVPVLRIVPRPLPSPE
jgi:signal transduction histidine kinase